MADSTTHETTLSRDETAEFLREIADEVGSDKEKIRVSIGNKEIELSPPERVDSTATVIERSRRLRKDTEELELHFKWNPTKDTASSEGESR